MGPAANRTLSKIGTVIDGKYRLDALIGEGGMATVWRGQHLTLNRPVAVKFLHVSAELDDIRERFLREARVVAAISHRNVVDIIDFGTTPEGRPYMIMEYLEGESLADRLVRGPPLSVADTVRIVARTLSGLSAVHEAGIVHRDVKPDNIFLVKESDGIFPKLLDFGISRAVGDVHNLESVLPSRENVITGTPQYMSPEQARAAQDVDHRTDIYAMGVILYQVLTGRLPFDSDNVGDLIVMILVSDVLPLSRLRSDLGEPLSVVVERAMNREREARFQSAREMRTALLEAATKTAVALADAKHGRVESAAGASDFPGLEPEELMNAVGASYEPGESGVMDSRSLSQGEIERVSHAPTLDGEAPRRSRRPGRALLVGLAAGLLIAVAAVGVRLEVWRWPDAGVPKRFAWLVPWMKVADDPALKVGVAHAAKALPMEGLAGDPVAPAKVEALVPEPEPEPLPEPEPVSITLTGVPEEAVVILDGSPHPGGAISLPQDGEPHEIEVRAEGFVPWSVMHTADGDGTYEVALERDETPGERRRRLRRERLRRQRARVRARRKNQGKENLFTDPGF